MGVLCAFFNLISNNEEVKVACCSIVPITCWEHRSVTLIELRKQTKKKYSIETVGIIGIFYCRSIQVKDVRHAKVAVGKRAGASSDRGCH